MNNKERNLFFGVWVVLLIFAALWHFRPTEKTDPSRPTIVLDSQLRRWFAEASVLGESPRGYLIQFTRKVDSEAIDSGLYVRYSLIRQNRSRKIGIAEVNFDKDSASLLVPLLERSSVDSIQLELGH